MGYYSRLDQVIDAISTHWYRVLIMICIVLMYVAFVNFKTEDFCRWASLDNFLDLELGYADDTDSLRKCREWQADRP